MNKKFYILPQNGGEKFRQILKAIPATPQEKQILQEASHKTRRNRFKQQFLGNPYANVQRYS